ncbi:carbon-nitrogen hydrolase family protein, partial [Burkholderia cenocepacia]|nr:carbon-nitrogen hydrolase family protein [Burkholderia cenocepacia]
LGIDVQGWDPERPDDHAAAADQRPLGDPLTEPLIGEAGLVTARIDTDELVKARYDFDVVGHYARADVFSL